MCARVVVERFGEGMSDDRFEYGTGNFSASKYFDIFTYPRRLVPTRTTTTDNAVSTGIGNLLVGSDGIIYGLGNDGTNNQQLYKKADNATNWAALSNGKTGSSAVNGDLFIEYADTGAEANKRSIFCNGNAGIGALDKSNGGGVRTHSLTYTSLSQGLVHPKNDRLYIPYTTSTGTFIARYDGSLGLPDNAGAWADTALTAIPTALVVTSVSFYGNYLAIACAPRGAFALNATGKVLSNSSSAGQFKSIVYLWDMDESLNTISETIDWGTGILQVLNNLNGRLVGISNVGGGTAGISNIIDRNSIEIKTWAGGVAQLVKEISTERQTTTVPSVNVNPNVNFIYRDRLYFSIDIVGGSTSPSRYGLWAFGLSKTSGRYAVTIERGATTDDSETSVLAAAATGDYFSMVYTTAGTMGFSVNNSNLTSPFNATSYYESCVNPGMLLLRNTRHDFALRKQLTAVAVSFLPLIAGQTVIAKYRVDSSSGATGTLGAGWTTIRTYTSANAGKNVDSLTYFETTRDAANNSFSAGSYFEFRLETTGGAVITEYSYKYSKPTTIMKDE